MKTTKRNHGSPWTLQELEYVEKHYSKMSCADIGESLGRSANAVRAIAQKLGYAPQKTPDWSDGETDILRATYGTDLEVDEICAMLPARSAVSVVIKARKLGLTRPEPFWQQRELKILRRYYPSEGKKVVARLSGRSNHSVILKAARLGIIYQGNKNYRKWSEDELLLLAQNHSLPIAQLCTLFPERSLKSVEFAQTKYRKRQTNAKWPKC
ncbi:hypothetical protein [Serratia oryzae]|uniref:Uncharacterized protein n=1 Tax=Serratia oryzae TaxID=2034155 RepID=A0A1S8CED4_9GAMM|nr:hypothetical protein [Serratia oryzae]OMQ19939.1 hypothetical protein BMI79_20885 [Serratia oryzae]